MPPKRSRHHKRQIPSSLSSSSFSAKRSAGCPSSSSPQPSTKKIKGAFDVSSSAPPSSTATRSPAAAELLDGATQKVVRWYWADDSSSASQQDTWVRYRSDQEALLEKAYLQWQKLGTGPHVAVDKLRHVDLPNMAQRRNDKPHLYRLVNRALLDPLNPIDPVMRSTTTTGVGSKHSHSLSESSESTEEEEVDDDDDDDDDDDYRPYRIPHTNKAVIWYWYSDSPGGHQDVPVKYAPKISRRIEKAFENNRKKVKVDDERYVDFRDFQQHRHDDESKQRLVNRKEIVLKKQPHVVQTSSTRARTSRAPAPSGAPASRKSIRRGMVIVLAGKVGKNRAAMEAELSSVGLICAKQVTAKTNVVVFGSGNVSKDALTKAKSFGTATWAPEELFDALKAFKSGVKKSSGALDDSSDDDTDTDTDSASDGELSDSEEDEDSLNVPTAASLDISSNAMFGFPTYWKPMSALAKIEVDVDPTSTEFAEQRDLFTSTIDSSHKNAPHIHKVKFSTFQVTRLVRVQNPTLWLRYHTRREKIRGDISASTPDTGKVMMKCVDKAVNEFYFYHGLNSCYIPGISQFGFDPRFCSLEGMFGAGLYFAENSSKSNQYVHTLPCTLRGPQPPSKCKCLKKSECCMLVCRVLLGDALIEKKYRGNRPSQFWHGRRTEPTKKDGSAYHSVIGECRRNFRSASLKLREYIVYESSQVYPEYLLYYKRK